MNEQLVAYKEITQEEFELLKSFVNLVEPVKGLFLDREATPVSASTMMPVVMQKDGRLLMRMDYLQTLAFGAVQAGLAAKNNEAPASQNQLQEPNIASVKSQMEALLAAVMETYAADFAASNPSPVANRGFKLYEQDVQQDLKKILEQF